jgi:hypothetical protein
VRAGADGKLSGCRMSITGRRAGATTLPKGSTKGQEGSDNGGMHYLHHTRLLTPTTLSPALAESLSTGHMHKVCDTQRL